MKVEPYLAKAETLQLQHAILLYVSNMQTLATIHDVMQSEGEFSLLPGKCVTREMVDDLLRTLSNAPMTRQILPPEVICDTGCLCWWKPATKAPIFFNTKDTKFNKEVSGKTVLHPPLLFLAKPGRLEIFALKENERPGAETVLCRAPYYNLYDEGAMCRGNVRLPEVCQVRDIPIWEKAFFETNFTHSNIGGQKLTTHPGGHDGLWQESVRWAAAMSTFPDIHNWYLIPLKITIQEAVNK